MLHFSRWWSQGHSHFENGIWTKFKKRMLRWKPPMWLLNSAPIICITIVFGLAVFLRLTDSAAALVELNWFTGRLSIESDGLCFKLAFRGVTFVVCLFRATFGSQDVKVGLWSSWIKALSNVLMIRARECYTLRCDCRLPCIYKSRCCTSISIKIMQPCSSNLSQPGYQNVTSNRALKIPVKCGNLP